MSGNKPNRALAEWVNKAEQDYKTAQFLHAGNAQGEYSDSICFHSQQCIEKLLKALLIRYM
jgi:HEPN domain-containing protein